MLANGNWLVRVRILSFFLAKVVDLVNESSHWMSRTTSRLRSEEEICYTTTVVYSTGVKNCGMTTRLEISQVPLRLNRHAVDRMCFVLGFGMPYKYTTPLTFSRGGKFSKFVDHDDVRGVVYAASSNKIHASIVHLWFLTDIVSLVLLHYLLCCVVPCHFRQYF